MKEHAKYLLFFWLLALIPLHGWTQQFQMKYRNRLGDSVVLVNTAVKPPRKKLPKRLSHALSGGFRFRTNGWGVFVDYNNLFGNSYYGRENRNKYFQAKVVEVSFGEVKHAKEISSSSALPGMSFVPGSYILGKINNFYRINLGYGRRRLLAGKPDPGTISIHWVYLGGFSAGLVKPYYIKLYHIGTVKYSKEIEKEFITPGLIEGKAGFGKGWNDVKFDPGLFFKTALHFDFSPRTKGLMALETGVIGSFYLNKVDQMVGQDAKQLFFSFYASLQFGGKW